MTNDELLALEIRRAKNNTKDLKKLVKAYILEKGGKIICCTGKFLLPTKYGDLAVRLDGENIRSRFTEPERVKHAIEIGEISREVGMFAMADNGDWNLAGNASFTALQTFGNWTHDLIRYQDHGPVPTSSAEVRKMIFDAFRRT